MRYASCGDFSLSCLFRVLLMKQITLMRTIRPTPPRLPARTKTQRLAVRGGKGSEEGAAWRDGSGDSSLGSSCTNTETMLETRQVTETCDLSELDTLASSNVVIDTPPEAPAFTVDELPARHKEGETFSVVITHVDSPSQFLFNLQQSGYLDLINEFYRGARDVMYMMSRANHLKPGNI